MRIAGAASPIHGRARELATQVAQRSACGSADVVEPMFASESIHLFTVRRPEEPVVAPIAGASPDGNERYWFTGEHVGDHRVEASAATDVTARVRRLCAELEGDFLGVRIDGSQRVWLHGDTWGLASTFVRQLRDGVVFGPHFGAVCAAGADAPAVDEASLLLELAIGYEPTQRTVFRDVATLPPGGAVVIDGHTVGPAGRTTFEYGDRYAGLDDAAKFAHLDGLFEQMAARLLRSAGGKLAVSLSAGFDSRYALAWLERTRAVGTALTFGDPESNEVIDAHAVAQRAEHPLSWSTFPVRQASFDAWREMIQSTGNAGVVQACGWFDAWLRFFREHSANCVIGFLGDALSGKRLDTIPAHDARAERLDPALDLWARRWMAFELDMGEWVDSPLLRPGARERLAAAATARFAELVSTGKFARAHQSAHHLNLFGRQRRWTGVQPALLAQEVKPLLFFVDRAYRDFWMNVGLDDLHGQSLYHRYAEQRMPRWFPPGPSPAIHLMRRVTNRARRELDALRGRRPPPRRPPPISRELLLEGKAPAMLELLERTRSTLDAIIDCTALARAIEASARGEPTNGVTHLMLIRAVNVMHLMDLRLAARLPAADGSQGPASTGLRPH